MRCAILAVLGASVAFADGLAFKGRDWQAMIPAAENEQIALIHQHDGVQEMLLSVDLEMADEEHGVWIFPVPGKAESTQVDIADEFPALSGRDPRDAFRMALSRSMTAVRAFAILPLLVEVGCLVPHFGGMPGLGLAVHAEVEKLGLHVGLVSAETLDDLTAYIGTRSATLGASALRSLAPYLDGKFVFVVTWITSKEEVKKAAPAGLRRVAGRKPCVFVRFATPEPFFPMRATSGYGDAKVGVRLFIVGHCEPVAGGYERELRAAHYDQGALAVQGSFQHTNILPDGKFPYTVIFGRVRAADLKTDLRFQSVRPRRMSYARAMLAVFVDAAPLTILALTALLSWLAGGIAGRIQFGRWREPAVLGLTNLLTLATLIILLRSINPSEWERSPAPAPADESHEHRLRRTFVRNFVIAFVLLTIGLQFAVLIPFFAL